MYNRLVETTLIERAVQALEAVSPAPALEFERAAKAALQALGFTVKAQVTVPNRGDGRRGRVDLYIPSLGLGIEIDRRSPRAKSRHKLSYFRHGLLVTIEPDVEVWCNSSLPGVNHLDRGNNSQVPPEGPAMPRVAG